MIESQSATVTSPRPGRKIPIQERSVRVGDVVVVNAYRVNRTLLKQRFAEGGYQVHETRHFLLFTRAEKPALILVHWFAPDEIDADIKHYVTQELKAFGIVSQAHQYGEIIGAIVGSFFPDDARRAWRLFGTNTLQRFLTFLATACTPPLPNYATIGMFATLYQRVCELQVGRSILDAGCASGFLPLLLAERIPFLTDIVGVDIQKEAYATAQELAGERHFTQVRFLQGDLLDADFPAVGQFDTVVALHVLEHFPEEAMYPLLRNLLRVTRKRLICAVPYEAGEPERVYGHQQLFSRTKLESVGQWCIEQLGGAGRLWCEDCVGGLFLIEKEA